MEQTAVPVTEQVREVVQAVVEVLREPKPEEDSPLVAANSFEAQALRAEIIRVGRKLWERQYVDGNGGNISVRLGSRYVLCTPTLLSKGDLEPADICLSDLDGNILAGDRARTSELLLHLEIYKANAKARAVVHCHPPYATAFAVTGTVPPNGLIPEYEVFIGPAAVAPYETPGTQAFAETVLPFVQNHNTILLTNHGIVCWSDTVTHAEWLAEILDTYCKTYLIAKQIGQPLSVIPDCKIQEILALKRRMGFPDARLALHSEAPCTVTAKDQAELERLVEQVVARLEDRD
ncbi:MAG: class II aldolase/adducin family protein [Terracidiphilus sp.]|jgi:L-fuculose-phosphate aldolase